MADDQLLLTSWNIGNFMNKLKIISTQLNTTKREEGGDVKINSNVKNIVGKKMKDISKILLNSDIRRFKSLITGILPSDINTIQAQTISGPFFLQIIKVDNISQPTYNQHGDGGGSRMLRVTMTDSILKVTGVEYESLKKINLSTPPGTKVLLLGNIFVRNGKLLLNSQNIKILGGEVSDLIESWKLKEQMDAAKRAGISIVGKRGGGPPPFEIGVKKMKATNSSKKSSINNNNNNNNSKKLKKGEQNQQLLLPPKAPQSSSSAEEIVFKPPKSNYNGPSLTQMVSGGFARKTAEQLKAEALEREQNRGGGYKSNNVKKQHEKKKSVEQKVEEAIEASERLNLNALPDFISLFEDLKTVKTKKNTQIPLKIQNMEIVEGNKKNNHGVMLAFTVEDLNGTIARLAADEGLFSYLAGCQDGGMMGMSLMQMGKSKSGMSYLKSQIEGVKPALIGTLYMFDINEPLRCTDMNHISLPPNQWTIVKQIDEVAPNVMDILKLKFPNKFRSSSSRNNNSKKSGTTYNNNYNNNNNRNDSGHNNNNNNSRSSNNNRQKPSNNNNNRNNNKKNNYKSSNNTNNTNTSNNNNKNNNNKSNRGKKGRGGRGGGNNTNSRGGKGGKSKNSNSNNKQTNGNSSGRGRGGGGRGRGGRGRGGRGRGGRGRGGRGKSSRGKR